MTSNSQQPGPLMVDIASTVLDAGDIELLQRPETGGLILFSRNYQSPEQLQDLVNAARAARPGLLIAVDQEGGRVQRFRNGFLALPALRRIGELFEQDSQAGETLAQDCGWGMASELLQYGIDFSFAPVLDLYSHQSRVIGDRAFAAEPSTVIHLARHYIKGMHEAGMPATGKHFPGHGTVAEDSHTELPRDERELAELRQTDLRSFTEILGCLDAIMPAHVVYPKIDDNCAGFSRVWINDILRQECQFDGIVFSDDLSMEAATQAGTVEQRAELALAAGCDMILVCNDRPAALRVADWLKDSAKNSNQRLLNMQGKPVLQSDNLYTLPRWRRLKEKIATL